MAVKLTFEAENETHLLDVIRAVALNEREQGLILDQQIERLEADNARRKPEAKRWDVHYCSPTRTRETYGQFTDKAEALACLKFNQENCLPDWEPEYFYLTAYAEAEERQLVLWVLTYAGELSGARCFNDRIKAKQALASVQENLITGYKRGLYTVKEFYEH